MTGNTPKITVGLPVFNGEEYVQEAIDSILGQTFEDFELLISDNGSTDRTREIAEDYCRQDERVRYLGSEQNEGAARNFNRVVGAARGEYFKWMAHDDRCAEGFLRKCLDPLERDDEVVLAYPKAADIDHEGTYLRDLYDNEVDLHTDAVDPAERYRYLVNINHSCIAVFGLMRTAVLRETPLIGSYVGSDRVLLAELALHGKFRRIPEVLLYHREHSGRSTRAIPDLQQRLRWFDTRLRPGRTFPNWRILEEHRRAVRRSMLPPGGKLACYFQLVRWLRRNYASLFADLVYHLRR